MMRKQARPYDAAVPAHDVSADPTLAPIRLAGFQVNQLGPDEVELLVPQARMPWDALRDLVRDTLPDADVADRDRAVEDLARVLAETSVMAALRFAMRTGNERR